MISSDSAHYMMWLVVPRSVPKLDRTNSRRKRVLVHESVGVVDTTSSGLRTDCEIDHIYKGNPQAENKPKGRRKSPIIPEFLLGRVLAHYGGALSRILIEVQAPPLPPRHLRRNPSSFTPDREGLVSTFSVFRSRDQMTAGVEGVVSRRM